jgi:hypothetical protein
VYERCLQEAELILAADKDATVPVKRVWAEVLKSSKRYRFEVPNFPDFTALLEAAPQFEYLSAHTRVTDDLDDPRSEDQTEDREEMEQLGVFDGDCVRLRSPGRLSALAGKVKGGMEAAGDELVFETFESHPKNAARGGASATSDRGTEKTGSPRPSRNHGDRKRTSGGKRIRSRTPRRRSAGQSSSGNLKGNPKKRRAIKRKRR